MTNHPPRITVSNTKIHLWEGALGQPCPTGEDGLGWVQLQQKSLLWQEMIEGFSVITHEGLTTLAHSSRMGWTITSGSWNHLHDKWGPTPETLSRIQASCKAQEYLEESNKLTPSRHILLSLREIWDLERSVTTGSHGTRFLPISIQERGVLVGNTGSEDDICAGLHG